MSEVQLLENLQYRNEEWRQQASCKDMSPSYFYIEGKNNIPQNIKALCNSCPVQTQCIMFAIDNHERYGIWGGMGYRARLLYVKKLKKTLN